MSNFRILFAQGWALTVTRDNSFDEITMANIIHWWMVKKINVVLYFCISLKFCPVLKLSVELCCRNIYGKKSEKWNGTGAKHMCIFFRVMGVNLRTVVLIETMCSSVWEAELSLVLFWSKSCGKMKEAWKLNATYEHCIFLYCLSAWLKLEESS